MAGNHVMSGRSAMIGLTSWAMLISSPSVKTGLCRYAAAGFDECNKLIGRPLESLSGDLPPLNNDPYELLQDRLCWLGWVSPAAGVVAVRGPTASVLRTTGTDRESQPAPKCCPCGAALPEPQVPLPRPEAQPWWLSRKERSLG